MHLIEGVWLAILDIGGKFSSFTINSLRKSNEIVTFGHFGSFQKVAIFGPLIGGVQKWPFFPERILDHFQRIIAI